MNTPNNSRASNKNNKRFVLNKDDDYNDRFLFVTVDEIYKLINKRSEFSVNIRYLLEDTNLMNYLQAIEIEGGKGIKKDVCSKVANADRREFCYDWIEMFLLTELSVAATITIDGVATAPCSRVLIFGGQKTGVQVRLTDNDKDNPANYLEGSNLAAFATPVANHGHFSGASTFNANNPSQDILKCL
jgi:hypothetical protein